jgi:hypothetical protein
LFFEVYALCEAIKKRVAAPPGKAGGAKKTKKRPMLGRSIGLFHPPRKRV